ncbi:MAG: hypothetical protein OXC12_13615 [Spirochaetaceae bacterium]|nr:hypothetical protein [Spirochaetaceae bacterium]
MNVFQRIKKGIDSASNAQLVAVEKAQCGVVAERREHLRQQVQRDTETLFKQRQRSVKVIEIVETYVNQLASTPNEFQKTVAHFKVQADRFREDVQRHEDEAARVAKVRAATGSTVAGAGAAVAALGPSAAMAIATTFGTASTGAAISGLSGAAATSAALSWLGGGALAAGGGGMAAGSALLALAGPIGWTVSGVAITGTVALARRGNRKRAEEARRQRLEIEESERSLLAAQRQIAGLEQQTRTHAAGTLGDLATLWKDAPSDYGAFDDASKERLAAVINHARSLGELLHERVET